MDCCVWVPPIHPCHCNCHHICYQVNTASKKNRIPYMALLYFAWAHQRHRQCCICHTAPEGGNFVACDTFYTLTHTISYLWHGREYCTQNIALWTGSREQKSTQLHLVLYCSLDPAPRAIICIQHSLPCYNYYIEYQMCNAFSTVLGSSGLSATDLPSMVFGSSSSLSTST